MTGARSAWSRSREPRITERLMRGCGALYHFASREGDSTSADRAVLQFNDDPDANCDDPV